VSLVPVRFEVLMVVNSRKCFVRCGKA